MVTNMNIFPTLLTTCSWKWMRLLAPKSLIFLENLVPKTQRSLSCPNNPQSSKISPPWAPFLVAKHKLRLLLNFHQLWYLKYDIFIERSFLPQKILTHETILICSLFSVIFHIQTVMIYLTWYLQDRTVSGPKNYPKIRQKPHNMPTDS